MDDEIILGLDKARAGKIRDASKVHTLAELDTVIQYYQTTIPEIDFSLGGIPRGCTIQMAGDFGAGKTTLCAHCVVGALSLLPDNCKVGFQDFECRLNLGLVRNLCKQYDINPERFLFQQPASGDEGLQTMLEWIDDENVVILVGDSLKAIVPAASVERDMNKNAQMMANQRLVNEFFERILARVKHLNKSLIFIDHLKKVQKQGLSFPIWETTSGLAAKFYSSARWFLKKKQPITKTKKGEALPIGTNLEIQVKKTTVSPMGSFPLTLYYGRGVSSYRWYIEKAIEHGYMELNGKKWFVIGKDKTAKEIASTTPQLRRWVTGEGAKVWQKIVKAIRTKESKAFNDQLTADPEIFDGEFKL